jgi:hypothetical protein
MDGSTRSIEAKRGEVMSALGHERTFAAQKESMSALPPKADMRSAQAGVRYGPIADIQRGSFIGRTALISFTCASGS